MLGQVGRAVGKIASFSIIFFTLQIPYTYAHLSLYCLHCPWYTWYIELWTPKRRRRRFRESASNFRL